MIHSSPSSFDYWQFLDLSITSLQKSSNLCWWYWLGASVRSSWARSTVGAHWLAGELSLLRYFRKLQLLFRSLTGWVVGILHFAFKIIMPYIDPFLDGKVVHLVFLRLEENLSEVCTSLWEGFVTFYVVEAKAFPELSVAYWAEVDWVSVSLLQVVGAHHEALVEDAVTMTKHMADFVCCNFADSHQNLALKLLLSIILFIGEVRHESAQALDTSKWWNTVSEAEVAQTFGEEVDISERNDTNGIALAVLNWSNDLVKNANSIVLGLAKAIPLGTKLAEWDLFQSALVDLWKDHNLAWHVECLKPLFELIHIFIGNPWILLFY